MAPTDSSNEAARERQDAYWRQQYEDTKGQMEKFRRLLIRAIPYLHDFSAGGGASGLAAEITEAVR